jgi:drug/metabolite transporter (DMT)-like permease
MRAEWAARWFALPLSVAAISTSGILIRFTTAPPLQTAAYRMAMAGLLLLAIALATQRGELVRLTRRDWSMLAAAGLLLGVHFALWTNALFATSVASAVLLVDTHPVMIALGGWVFLGEAPAAMTWAAIALTLIGSIVIASGDLDLGPAALTGDAMALGAAVTFAGYLLIGRHVRQRLGLAAYTGVVYSISALAVAAMALVGGVDLLDVHARDATIWLLLVLLPTLGGHTVINWTLRYLPASVVGVSILGEPVVTTLLAWLILDEPPGPTALIGGALTLAGVYLALRASVPSSSVGDASAAS